MHTLSHNQKTETSQPQPTQLHRAKLSQWFLSRKSNSSNHNDSKWLNMSLNRKHSDRESELPQLQSKTLQITQGKGDNIYFSRTKKYNYMKSIIDKYFQETKHDRFYYPNRHNPEQSGAKNQSIIPRLNRPQKDKDKDKVKDNQNRQKRKTFIHRKISDKNKEDQDLGDSFNGNIFQDNIDQTEIDITRSLSFSKKSATHNLPPIDQMYEGLDDQPPQYQSISYLNQTHLQTPQQTKIRVAENQAYVLDIVLSKGRPTHHLKTYQEKGLPILTREKKAQKMGVESVWIEYKYDQQALISAPNPSLKDLLFKAKRIDADSKFYTLKTKKYHKKLTTNRCQQLFRVLRELCHSMQQFQGKIVNHKLNTGNIYLARNENWKIGEWGFSSFRQTHLIQGLEFQNRVDPILKSQKEWFIAPEYMAPEIIRAVAFGEESDLMALGPAPDVWSIGVLIFQILTIIPVWIVQKCVIHSKQMQSRSGILATGSRDLKKMLKREQKLSYLMSKIIEEQFSEQEYPQELLQLMYRCVDYNPHNRPTYQQILQSLK